MHNFHSVQAETSKQGSFHDKLNMEFKKEYDFYHVFCSVVTLLVIKYLCFGWLVVVASLMLLCKDEIKYHKVPLNQFEILPQTKSEKSGNPSQLLVSIA